MELKTYFVAQRIAHSTGIRIILAMQCFFSVVIRSVSLSTLKPYYKLIHIKSKVNSRGGRSNTEKHTWHSGTSCTKHPIAPTEHSHARGWRLLNLFSQVELFRIGAAGWERSGSAVAGKFDSAPQICSATTCFHYTRTNVARATRSGAVPTAV